MNESLRNDNLPAEIELRDNLVEKHRDLVARMDDRLNTSATWLQVDGEEDAKQVSDVRRGLQALIKDIEAQHGGEKEPWLGRGRVVDGFFFPKRDKVKAELVRINRLALDYADKKEREERARREAEAAAARRAAEEAEALRLAEEAKRRKAFANPNSTAYDEAAGAAAAAVEAANKADKAALAKPAELARVRGDLGSVTSPKQRWTGEVTDRLTLDLETLRMHIPPDALNQAVRAWVKANSGGELAPPPLKGARCWREKYL
jgi:hypothetical protein